MVLNNRELLMKVNNKKWNLYEISEDLLLKIWRDIAKIEKDCFIRINYTYIGYHVI